MHGRLSHRARAIGVLLGAAVTVGLCGFVGVAPAAAATAPPNDLAADATAVTSLPFTQTVDTTAATTDADDAQLNETCGAPATNNSVWYTFVAGASDTVLFVDTTGSDFSSGVDIGTGTPGALTTQACGPISTHVATTAGTTYYILVFDDSGSGGTLQLSIHGAGPKPPNDRLERARAISRVPYSDSLDTTGATESAVDSQLSCGAPATTNTVWYTLTPTAAQTEVVIDASASDYFVGLTIASGSPGSFAPVACGAISVVATLQPGTTYTVMVFDPFAAGGGQLRLHVGLAPIVGVAIQRRGAVDGSGTAYLSGTYTCQRASEVGMIGEVVEIVGSKAESSPFRKFIGDANCNAKPHAWQKVVRGKFASGEAALFVDVFACQPGEIVCTAIRRKVVVTLIPAPMPDVSQMLEIDGPATTAVSPHARYGPLAHPLGHWTPRAAGNET